VNFKGGGSKDLREGVVCGPKVVGGRRTRVEKWEFSDKGGSGAWKRRNGTSAHKIKRVKSREETKNSLYIVEKALRAF